MTSTQAPWYVFFKWPESPETRYPSQFSTEEAAKAFAHQRKQMKGEWEDATFRVSQNKGVELSPEFDTD